MNDMGAFLKGFHKGWPADLATIDEAHLSVSGGNHGKIFYRGPALRPPFHRGLNIAWYYGAVEQRHGEDAARSLSELLLDHPGAVARMMEVAERAERESRAAGCRLKSYVPTGVYSANTSFMIKITCDIEMIDDVLVRRAVRFELDDRNNTTSWSELRRELRAQTNRLNQSGKGFEVDPVLGWHLAAMPETQLQKIADLLADSPMPSGDDKGRAYAPLWDRGRLHGHGIHLPEAITSLKIKDGRMVGKVRLGPTLTWNKGKLTATDRLPNTVVSALVGRPLSTLVQHPALPDFPIASANVQQNGFASIKVDISESMLAFPSGLWNLR